VTGAEDASRIDRIASRFATRSHRSYVRGKLGWDPLFAAVVPVIVAADQPLLDVGCGIGLLGQTLRESGFAQGYRGLDLDAEKIDAARAAATRVDLELAFDVGSATALPDFAGSVAMLDVLHYLPRDAQRDALDAGASRVARGGVLVIRNVVRDDTWRFRATVLQERISRGLGWMRCETGHFPTQAEIVEPLRAAGLAVETTPLWGKTPFNSWLFVGRRAVS
jgi:2-polyprenyl-3-methyl-5-hydroxy-6-metoxy-1,4-benzoquinol methylase